LKDRLYKEDTNHLNPGGSKFNILINNSLISHSFLDEDQKPEEVSMTNQGDINNIRNGKILDTMANKYDFDKTMIENLEKGNISKAMCEAITTPLFNIDQ
jgi:hypothetical protein